MIISIYQRVYFFTQSSIWSYISVTIWSRATKALHSAKSWPWAPTCCVFLWIQLDNTNTSKGIFTHVGLSGKMTWIEFALFFEIYGEQTRGKSNPVLVQGIRRGNPHSWCLTKPQSLDWIYSVINWWDMSCKFPRLSPQKMLEHGKNHAIISMSVSSKFPQNSGNAFPHIYGLYGYTVYTVYMDYMDICMLFPEVFVALPVLAEFGAKTVSSV